jgi:hypothetical protein
MIKFIVEEERQIVEQDKDLTLADVEEGQFFVDKQGQLCQKYWEACYCVIADENGEPLGGSEDCEWNSRVVSRILPKVKRIEF